MHFIVPESSSPGERSSAIESKFMTVSSFQIRTVIRAYMKNMRARAESAMDDSIEEFPDDNVTISEEALRRRFFGRIGERVAEKLRVREQEY